MKTRLIIIKVLGKWWQMSVGLTIVHTDQMRAGADIPLQLMQMCEEIYDATTKEMIKSRKGDTHLNDAMVLKLWLGNNLPVFEYGNYKMFRRRVNEYYQTIAA